MGLHLVRTRCAPLSSPRSFVPFLALLAGVLVVIPGCGEDVLLPEGEPDDAGVVAALGRDVGPGDADREGLLTRLHVKTSPADPNECGIIYDVFDESGPVETVLRRLEADGSLSSAEVSDVTLGARVRIWHTGDIAESCPEQGVATIVELVEE